MLPNRTATAMYQIKGGDAIPRPVIVSCVTGKDSYDQSADISATVNGTFNGVPISGSTSVPSSATAQKLERTNYFGDVALNLPLFKIVGEVGQVSGGKVATYNGFAGGRADKDQQYFSVGIRIGL